MKKKIIWLIVIVLLIAAMVAALVLLNKAPAAETEAASSKADTIFVMGSYDAPDADTVNIENETGSFTVLNKTSDSVEPVLMGFEGFSLDSYGLNNILAGAKYLTAKRVVEENAADLSLYGFDEPRVTFTAKSATGAVTVLIGNDAPGGEGVYVKTKDNATVYLVASPLIDPFFRSEFDFINKTITETDPEFSGFKKIILTGENYPEPIVIEEIPEDVETTSQFVTHLITSPIETIAISNGLEALSSVYGLLATKVVGVAKDNDAETLETFGLQNPAAAVSLYSDSQALSFTLRVSAPNPDGTVYLIKSGSPVIYQLDQQALPWLSLTLFDYMDKIAMMPHIDTVSNVNLTIGDTRYTFSLTGEGDEFAVSLNGTPVPDAKKDDGSTIAATENFRKMYQTLISASYAAESEDTPDENAAPVMTFEYVYKDGKASDFVRFYGGAPTRRMYICVNGGTAYLVPSTYLDAVRENLGKLMDGVQIKII